MGVDGIGVLQRVSRQQCSQVGHFLGGERSTRFRLHGYIVRVLSIIIRYHGGVVVRKSLLVTVVDSQDEFKTASGSDDPQNKSAGVLCGKTPRA